MAIQSAPKLTEASFNITRRHLESILATIVCSCVTQPSTVKCQLHVWRSSLIACAQLPDFESGVRSLRELAVATAGVALAVAHCVRNMKREAQHSACHASSAPCAHFNAGSKDGLGCEPNMFADKLLSTVSSS